MAVAITGGVAWHRQPRSEAAGVEPGSVIVKVELRNDEVPVGAEEQLYAERATRLTLGRFGARISQISISVGPGGANVPGDAEGSRADARQVAVRVDGRCRLLVLETDRTFESALVRALDRARRYLERDGARMAVHLRGTRRHRGPGLAALARGAAS